MALRRQIGQTAELLGYALDRATVRPGQSVELLTFWRVIGRPPAMLSVMAHLRRQRMAGRLPWATDWALRPNNGRSAMCLSSATACSRFPLDAPPGPVTVQTGLYTLDNLQRLAVIPERHHRRG